MLPQYRFKVLAELCWAMLTAVLIVVAQTMFTLQPEQVQDWRAWAVGLAGALVRALGGALLSSFAKMGISHEEPRQ